MKHKTNVQLITELMEYSKAGALMQAFVIEALAQYSKKTLAAKPWPPNGFIDQSAWKACATEALKAIEERK